VPRGASFGFEELKRLYEKLREASPEERMEMKGLDPLRSDLILSGAAVAHVLMKALRIDKITYCEQALREGMIYRYIQKNRRKIQSEAEIPDVRRRNVLKLAHKCDYDRAHAHHVAKLALQIFDRMQAFHELSSLDRELLEYSALLHDIGYHIGYEQHHLHAYYLIKNVPMNGFTDEEIDIMAQVARYHRRAIPKKKHPFFSGLLKPVRRRVKWLSAILKVADALDRSHFSVVESVKPRIYSKKIIFQVTVSDDSEYEVWEATHKCDLLESLLKKDIVFKMKKMVPAKKTRAQAKGARISRMRKALQAVK
jgi:exopolyphosphatase/guanosine-5'-triphosphate,3'-diphosphate pyrophosphatase